MTTLVALPTKDAVVMGCDSLATASRLLVDPRRLLNSFDEKGRVLRDSDGRDILDFGSLLSVAEHVPYDHMTDVDKLVHLKPLPLGVMFTGITSLGDRTVKSLLREFRRKDPAFRKSTQNYTVKSVSGRLLKFFRARYENFFRGYGSRL